MAGRRSPAAAARVAARRACPKTHGELVDALAQATGVREAATAHSATRLASSAEAPATPLTADDAAVRWRLPYMVASILDSPYHVRSR